MTTIVRVIYTSFVVADVFVEEYIHYAFESWELSFTNTRNSRPKMTGSFLTCAIATIKFLRMTKIDKTSLCRTQYKIYTF
jgi:hypothetical protein